MDVTAQRLQVFVFGATRVRAPQAAPAAERTTDRTTDHTTDHTADQRIKGVKPRQILGMLAARPGEPLSKDVLAERLWDGRPPRSYLATLESYVCVLRRQLTAVAGTTGFVVTASRGYLLDPAKVEVDAAQFLDAVEGCGTAAPADVVDATRRALRLVTGRLLASEPYEPWAEEERRSFDAVLNRVCLAAAERAWLSGDHESTMELADRVLQLDPLTEAAWLLRIKTLAATSRPLEALRCYAAMESVLMDELGVEPPAEAQALQLSLLRSVEPGARNPGQQLRALLGLLRHTLETVPGLDVPVEDEHLSAVAAKMIHAA